MDIFVFLPRFSILALYCFIILMSDGNCMAAPTIIDHRHTDITKIPQTAIEQAKNKLHIAYGHTSHGSQLTAGMTGLVEFANGGGLGLSLPENIFAWNNGGSSGALDLHDYAMGGDLGSYPNWVNSTRMYLDDPANADVNVILWSWCGQVDAKYAAGTLQREYLTPMSELEVEYPNVKFVYMTGHVDITDDANNKAANQMIRNFCITNEKYLYDFASIERYDPDGNYFEYVHDNCRYYSQAGGEQSTILGNWATEWQSSHTEGVDWYDCHSAHSEPLNANRKAYAAWWLFATLAGWSSTTDQSNTAPSLQHIGNQQVECNQLLTIKIMATDQDSDDSLSYKATPLPEGALFDSTQGTFSWTPTLYDVGDHQITFSVFDDGFPQGLDRETLTISVLALENNPDDNNEIVNSGGSHNSTSNGGCFLCIIWCQYRTSDNKVVQ